MEITMLKGKIHRATVTQAALDYVGSITVDEDLLEAAGIREYEEELRYTSNHSMKLWVSKSAPYEVRHELGFKLLSL